MAEKNNQIYIWHGENDYDIRKNLDAWKARFSAKYSNMNIINIDLEDPSLKKDILIKDLKNAFYADSIFSNAKLIILKNFFLTDPKKIAVSIKPKLKEIENLLCELSANLPKDFYVIFWQKSSADKRKTVYKKIKLLANEKEFGIPKGMDLTKWIFNEFKENNCRVENYAVQKLILLCGGNLWLLGNEIKKLCAYKKGEPVLATDVEVLVKAKFDDNIFNLMDAISNKNKKSAIKFFYDQLNSGAEELYLLAMTIKQFRTLLKTVEIKQENFYISSDQLSKILKVHPFVAKKSLEQAGNFKLEELKRIYKELLQMDLKIKSTGVKLPMLFDMFISRI